MTPQEFVERYAHIITLEMLLDMKEVFGLRLGIEIIGSHGTKPRRQR